jgi:hypothetical protein
MYFPNSTKEKYFRQDLNEIDNYIYYVDFNKFIPDRWI